MVRAITHRIETVRAEHCQGPGQLAVVPIIGPTFDQPDYRLLDEEAAGAVRVEEVDKSGSVPVLKVSNTLDQMVYLMDGQELVGAKQNRVLNTDVLVPARTKLEIPVSCVEAGRWHYSRPDFMPGGHNAFYSVRRNKIERLKENLKHRKSYDAGQGQVWEEVGMAMSLCRAHSPTSAMADAYHQRKQDLEKFRREMKLPDRAVGLAVYRGRTFLGLDLFDKHTTLQYFWRSLVDSYAIEWLYQPFDPQETAKEPLELELAEILRQVGSDRWEGFDSPGLGRDYRLEHERYNGSALVWDERVVVHMQLFPRPRKQGDLEDARTCRFSPHVRRRRRPRHHPDEGRSDSSGTSR